VKVNAGHSVGKTSLAAVAVLWWYYTRPRSVIITTAPTQRDVVDLLWTEIRVLSARAGLKTPFVGPRAPEIFDTEEHSAKGYTSSTGDSFQGRHRESMFFVFDECHDDKTEVLTDEGWKFFSDLTGLEQLLSMDPTTQAAEYINPLRIVKRWHNGEMYHHKCSGVDYCVTPGHRMLWHTRHMRNGETVLGGLKLTRMDDLFDGSKAPKIMSREIKWHAPDAEFFTIPALETAKRSYPEQVVPMDLWLEFLGWYFSEGHLIKAKIKSGIAVYGIAISQKDQATLSHIYQLAVKLGFPAKLYSCPSTPQVHIHSAQIGRWFAQFGPTCLKRRLPDFLRYLSVRQANVFLDAYVKGDGYQNTPTRQIIYTSAPRLAAGLHELILKTGVDSTVLIRPLAGKKTVIDGHAASSSCDGYIISRMNKPKRIKFNRQRISKIHYEGFVYCAELPKYHVLYTRRNGRALWSGNCEGVAPIYWQTTDTMFKPGEDHAWLAIGNPITTSSQSYLEDLATGADGRPKWKPFQLSALNHPNVIAELDGRPGPVPNAVSLGQVQQWLKDWTEPVSLSDKRQDDVEWPPQSGMWYRPGPLFKGRVLGLRPTEGVNSAFSMSAWTEAVTPRYTNEYVWLRKYGITIGVDVATYGDDNSVIHVRCGPLSVHHESHNGWLPKKLADRVKRLCVEWAAIYNSWATIPSRPQLAPKDVKVIVELDGPGVAVLDRCDGFGHWTGLKVAEASEVFDSMNNPRYSNKRSEMWMEADAKAREGKMDLSRLSQDVKDRLRTQLLTPSYVLLPNGSIKIEEKKDVKLRLKRSPDDADALLVCYSEAQTWLPQLLGKSDTD
jgi:hypothetical protein